MDDETRRELALVIGGQVIEMVEAQLYARRLVEALDAQTHATMQAQEELSELRATLARDGTRR